MDMGLAVMGGMIVRSLIRRIFRNFGGEGASKLPEQKERGYVDRGGIVMCILMPCLRRLWS